MKYFLAAIGSATAIMLLFYLTDRGVLGTAAQYADDEPTLRKFMSDMGYPKTGEWCGEFAASVIKRAGGTPPPGAAIASNWRGYGTPDAMPHVGDVAVADRGVPTGATGSHVGFVSDVNFKNGTFTLESGNARNIYTTRKISCFSFHMPPNDVLSALTGNGVPSGAVIGDASAGMPLRHASVGFYPPDPDDRSRGCLETCGGNLRPQATSTARGFASFVCHHLMRRDFARMHGRSRSAMSAFGGKADIVRTNRKCCLLTQNGHEQLSMAAVAT
jgi:hypothetical protein